MRYVLSIIGVVLFVVVVIVIVASHSSGSSSGKRPTIHNAIPTDYSNGTSSVSQITTGALVGENQRVAIEITVTQNERDLSILSGYNQTVSSSQSFPNTPAAYQAFLEGLTVQNFTKNRPTTEKNIAGVCPLGNTYYYILTNKTDNLSNLWSTSCSISDGNFDGQGSTIRTLFQAQIPNYQVTTQNINFMTQ